MLRLQMFIITNQHIARFLVDIFVKEVVKYISFVTLSFSRGVVVIIQDYRLKESNDHLKQVTQHLKLAVIAEKVYINSETISSSQTCSVQSSLKTCSFLHSESIVRWN